MRTAQKMFITFILSSACILVYQYQLSRARYISEDIDGGNGELEVLNLSIKKLLSNNGGDNSTTSTTTTITPITTTTVGTKKDNNNKANNNTLAQFHQKKTDESETTTTRTNNNHYNVDGNGNRCTCNEDNKSTSSTKEHVIILSALFLYLVELSLIFLFSRVILNALYNFTYRSFHIPS